jgi:hypothetical protein
MAKGHIPPTPTGHEQGDVAGNRMPVSGPDTDDPTPRSPLLPHEHDESPEIAPGSRSKVMRRAQRDIVEGRVDTEVRSNAVRHFERAAREAPAHAVRVRRGRKDST